MLFYPSEFGDERLTGAKTLVGSNSMGANFDNEWAVFKFV